MRRSMFQEKRDVKDRLLKSDYLEWFENLKHLLMGS